MKTGTTNIKLNYKPLNTSVSTTFLSGNPKQTFDSDSDTFQPDRRIDPLTIKVNCLVSDTYGFVDGSVNASLTDISWKILDSNGVSTDIISTNTNYKIGTGAEKGQLRVFQNVNELAPITIVFTASYLEPKSKRIAKFQESINLSTITSSATPLQLDTDMPMGGALYVTKDTDRLLARGRLFRGKDEVPASYYWYDSAGNELTDTNGITGSKTKMISIPSTQISKTGDVIRVEVADCSNYVNQLVNQKVDTDTQVVEWRGLYQSEGENFILNSREFKNMDKWRLFASITSVNIINGAFRIISAGSGVPRFASETLIPLEDKSQEFTISVEYISEINPTIDGKSSNSLTLFNELGSQMSGNFTLINTDVINGNHKRRIYKWNTLPKREALSSFLWISIPVNSTLDLISFKVEKGSTATNWSPSKQDLNNLVTQKTTQYKSETKLPENYRPSVKPSKVYKADFLLIKRYPSYTEEVLVTQGGIDASATSVQVEMIIKTNEGVLQNPEKYFSVKWYKQANGTYKYNGFKVNVAMADIIALQSTGAELDYELTEIK